MVGIADQKYLRNDQYKSPVKLQARINLHSRFGKNPTPWHQWVYDQLKIQPGNRILEIGCGLGDLWANNMDCLPSLELLVLSDFSSGMVLKAQQSLFPIKNTAFLISNAQHIPVYPSLFDFVIANHMLYHVPDIPKALSEIRRVLKPGGHFCAATNGKEHMLEIHQMIMKYNTGYSFEGREAFRFSLDNAQKLGNPYFSNTSLLIYDDHLEVTDPDALLDYISSVGSMTDGLTSIDIGKLRKEIVYRITNEGCIYITKSQGLLLGTKSL